MEKNDKSGESNLDRVALEEILKEAKRGKDRAETMGPMGWIKCPLVPTNKRFFRNILMGTLTNQKRDDRMKERKHQKESLSKGSSSSLQDTSIERKTNDRYEKSKQSHSLSKYSNEPNVQKASKDKYKQSIKDNNTESRSSKHRHGYINEEKHKKNIDHVTKKRFFSSDGKTNNDGDDKLHMDRNQRKKRKLEKEKNELHSHVKRKKK